MKYALDTNTLVYFFKDLGNVKENLLEKDVQDIGIPSIVVYELQVGIEKSSSPEKRTKQLKTLLKSVKTLPFGLEEARKAAEIRATLEKQGNIIGRYDYLIAGTALANNLLLVTRNQKEFERIPSLNLVDWYE